MIEALILGKLHARAEQRTAKTGKPFVIAKVRTAAGEGDSLFVNVITFSESAGATLLALDAGDSVALSGSLKTGIWTDREGVARPSLDLVASQVLTAYGLTKKRAAIAKATEPPASSAPHREAASEDFGAAGEWAQGDNHG
jgi:single-stranded DNA-binding protein